MSTTYRIYAPDQALLLPSSLKDWLPERHLAYFISDAVDALDLAAFHARYTGDGRRRQPFDPASTSRSEKSRCYRSSPAQSVN